MQSQQVLHIPRARGLVTTRGRSLLTNRPVSTTIHGRHWSAVPTQRRGRMLGRLRGVESREGDVIVTQAAHRTEMLHLSLVEMVKVGVSAAKEQPRLPQTPGKVPGPHQCLPVLQKTQKGGDPCSGANHDDAASEVPGQVEGIRSSWENGYLSF